MEFFPIDSSRLVLSEFSRMEFTRGFSNGLSSNRLESTRLESSLRFNLTNLKKLLPKKLSLERSLPCLPIQLRVTHQHRRITAAASLGSSSSSSSSSSIPSLFMCPVTRVDWFYANPLDCNFLQSTRVDWYYVSLLEMTRL